MAGSDSDPLDELYWAKPDGFIALRTKLSAAAKQRGDRDTARQISITNRPTTAAWVVNRLAIRDREARQRLAHLGDRLRAAHAAMDGDQIRDLSALQRRLIDELTRAAFDAAELRNPSAAIRDDVGATLQAAIADPDVRASLGRLTRPARWSGFGALGDAAPVVGAGRSGGTRSGPAAGKQAPQKQSSTIRSTEKQAAAEQAKKEADDALSERRAELAAARARRDEARRSLRAAERDLGVAEQDFAQARQVSRNAADLVRAAKAEVSRAR